MTLQELRTINSILLWAESNVKGDQLYLQVKQAEQWIKREIALKTTDFVRNIRMNDVSSNQTNKD